jgi:uncharacterized protein
MNCPNCNEVLVMSERQGVEIDYCPKCRGVWLDSGELDKIIEKSASFESRDANSSYNQPSSDDYYRQQPNKHTKRKRGFLGDMFDFD